MVDKFPSYKMTKKRTKVLYYMAENPFWSKAGNLTRCLQMLQYFQSRSADLDVSFVSSINWNKEDEERFRETFTSINLLIEPFKSSKSNRIKYFLTDKLPWMLKRLFTNPRVNRVSPSFKSRFQKIVKDHGFDHLVISYVEFGELVVGLENVNKIVDTHDFFTLQKIQKSEGKKVNNVQHIFAEEMELLKWFDEIWTYSIEEQYIFNQFTEQYVDLIPLSFPKPIRNRDHSDYDLVYVASDNPHNLKSISWFIQEVLPKINETKVHVFGKICRAIPDCEQIVKHGLVDDLDAVYKKSKVAICPMLTGTGIKVKVLEALSYGIPVVTTRRGVDGLMNKINNGCIWVDSPEDFAAEIRALLQDKTHYDKVSIEATQFFDSFYLQENEWKMFDRKFIN